MEYLDERSRFWKLDFKNSWPFKIHKCCKQIPKRSDKWIKIEDDWALSLHCWYSTQKYHGLIWSGNKNHRGWRWVIKGYPNSNFR